MVLQMRVLQLIHQYVFLERNRNKKRKIYQCSHCKTENEPSMCEGMVYTNLSEFPVSYSHHDKGLFKFLLQNKLEDLYYCTLSSVTDRDVLANSSYPHLSINHPQFVETIFRTSPLECELFILQILKGLCHRHIMYRMWHHKHCTYIIK